MLSDLRMMRGLFVMKCIVVEIRGNRSVSLCDNNRFATQQRMLCTAVQWEEQCN